MSIFSMSVSDFKNIVFRIHGAPKNRSLIVIIIRLTLTSQIVFLAKTHWEFAILTEGQSTLLYRH